jgi:hypothetical protein
LNECIDCVVDPRIYSSIEQPNSQQNAIFVTYIMYVSFSLIISINMQKGLKAKRIYGKTFLKGIYALRRTVTSLLRSLFFKEKNMLPSTYIRFEIHIFSSIGE